MTEMCPACETGRLHAFTRSEQYPYGDAVLLVEGLRASACDVCGEELETIEQSRHNELLWADARRRHDGLLVSAEISAWRRRWRITQQAASKLLGGGANAFSKYERGEVCQSKAMDLLIRLSDRIPEARAILSEEAGIPFGAEDDWVTITNIVVHEPNVAGAVSREMSRLFDVAQADHPLHRSELRRQQAAPRQPARWHTVGGVLAHGG